MPFVTEWIGASSFEVILAGQSKHPSTGPLPLGLLVPDAFLSFCRVEELGEGFGWVVFARLLISWRKLQLSPLEHCPLAFHCQHSPRVLCSRCCPLILDHGVCLIISVSGLKILHSQILLDTSFHHCLQSVIIRSYFLLMNLQVIQFQYGLEFLRLSYSEFVQSFQDVIRWDLRHWQ